MKYYKKKHFRSENTFWKLYLLTVCGFLGFYAYIPGADKLYSNDMQYLLTAIFALVSLALWCGQSKKIKTPKSFRRFTLCLFCFILIEIVLTSVKYPRQSIVLTIKETLYYFIVWLVLLSFFQIKKSKMTQNRVANIIINISIICSVVAVVAYILYYVSDINILKLDTVFSWDKNNFRNGRLRFGVGIELIIYGALISFRDIIQKKSTAKDWICLFLSLIQILFFIQTRMLMLTLFATFIVFILINKEHSRFINIMGWMTVILLFFTSMFFVGEIYDGVNRYFEADPGIMIRFKAIKYYLEQLKSDPLFGMGLISSSREGPYWNLVAGTEGRFFRADVGVVGFLNTFGLIGFIFVVWILKWVFDHISKNSPYFTVQKAYLFFCIMTFPSLFCFDIERLRAFMIIVFWLLSPINEEAHIT